MLCVHFETTGLGEQDRITHVSVVEVQVKTRGNLVITDNAYFRILRKPVVHVVSQFYSYVNPQQPIPEEAQMISNISPQDVEAAPTIETVLPVVLRYLERDVAVSYSWDFTERFLRQECNRTGIVLPLPIYGIDIVGLLHYLAPERRSYKMKDVLIDFGYTVPKVPTAKAKLLVDMMTTVVSHFVYDLKDLAKFSQQCWHSFKQQVKNRHFVGIT